MMEEKDDIEYIKMVEKFTDVLWYYAKSDPDTLKRMKKLKISPRNINPYDKNIDVTKLVNMSRRKFRVMMDVIHTTGSIMPIRMIEGVITDEVIDAIHAETGQLDYDSSEDVLQASLAEKSRVQDEHG